MNSKYDAHVRCSWSAVISIYPKCFIEGTVVTWVTYNKVMAKAYWCTWTHMIQSNRQASETQTA